MSDHELIDVLINGTVEDYSELNKIIPFDASLFDNNWLNVLILIIIVPLWYFATLALGLLIYYSLYHNYYDMKTGQSLNNTNNTLFCYNDNYVHLYSNCSIVGFLPQILIFIVSYILYKNMSCIKIHIKLIMYY